MWGGSSTHRLLYVCSTLSGKWWVEDPPYGSLPIVFRLPENKIQKKTALNQERFFIF
ncbi:MAG: hypothetical protein IKI11_05960 [Neisseriaceae bacterium]|nr:hypothetical protein [Neisseriaceae bacterium]